MPRTIKLHDTDNVAIVADERGLPKGTVLDSGLTLRDRVPMGHKVALEDIAEGGSVRRYGTVIGTARADIPRGAWVSEALVHMPDAPELSNLPHRAPPPPLPALEGYSFEGFRNPDGSVGTRNVLAVSTSVQCVAAHAGVRPRPRAQRTPAALQTRRRRRRPHPHLRLRCGHRRAGRQNPHPHPAQPRPQPQFRRARPWSSASAAKNSSPNACSPKAHPPPTSCACRTKPSTASAPWSTPSSPCAAIVSTSSTAARETCPAADLTIGLQCGGSDAFSGVTANPALGFAADLLVRAGATVMFSEVTEVRDGIHLLTARAATDEVAAALVREMVWYDAYLARGGADRSANTTPGNKKGGLVNIVEKALGSIIKSGTTPIVEVLAPGERPTKRGMILRRHPRQRLHLRHPPIGLRHRPASFHHRPRHPPTASPPPRC